MQTYGKAVRALFALAFALPLLASQSAAFCPRDGATKHATCCDVANERNQAAHSCCCSTASADAAAMLIAEVGDHASVCPCAGVPVDPATHPWTPAASGAGAHSSTIAAAPGVVSLPETKRAVIALRVPDSPVRATLSLRQILATRCSWLI